MKKSHVMAYRYTTRKIIAKQERWPFLFPDDFGLRKPPSFRNHIRQKKVYLNTSIVAHAFYRTKCAQNERVPYGAGGRRCCLLCTRARGEREHYVSKTFFIRTARVRRHASLSELIADFRESYAENWHCLEQVWVGFPLPHDVSSNVPVKWKVPFMAQKGLVHGGGVAFFSPWNVFWHCAPWPENYRGCCKGGSPSYLQWLVGVTRVRLTLPPPRSMLRYRDAPLFFWGSSIWPLPKTDSEEKK